MNDSFDERPLLPEEVELNNLIARFGADYNAPPESPPLEPIRARVHAHRAARRVTRRRMVWGTAIAAGFAGVIITLARGRVTAPMGVEQAGANHPAILIAQPLQVRAGPANEELERAIKQAEAAVKANPEDPYFPEHLKAMRENARHFHEIQNRFAQGVT